MIFEGFSPIFKRKNKNSAAFYSRGGAKRKALNCADFITFVYKTADYYPTYALAQVT